VIAITIFTGFVCSLLANMQNDEGYQCKFWVAYEGFFFVMVLVHVCRMNTYALTPLLLCAYLLPVVLCACAFVATLGYVAWDQNENENREQVFSLILDSVAFSFLLAGTGLVSYVFDPRRKMSNQQAICEEHERVSALLDSMLPREVLMEMKSGQLSLAYDYEDMTFLYADIVGFTMYCAEHTAEQAVNLVTRLFAQFDEQAVCLGIYKVCTIGDAYVVVNEPRTQTSAVEKQSDCGKVFNMAKYMLQTIIKVRKKVCHDGLDMRIGLHCGSFVGGVIGTKRLRFDIWGEDVLVGNKVESDGKPGEICVSETAKPVLAKYDPNLQFHFNKDMTLKSGRVVSTFICKPPLGTTTFADEVLPNIYYASQGSMAS